MFSSAVGEVVYKEPQVREAKKQGIRVFQQPKDRNVMVRGVKSLYWKLVPDP